MTVIVGLVCKDGLVVASESQESSEDEKRLDVKKIYGTETFGFTDAEIIVGGTGSSAFIARAAELITELGYAPHFTTPRNVANIVEDAMGKMKDRYGDDLDVELLVGVYCKNCPPDEQEDQPIPSISLYSVYPPEENEKVGVAEIVHDYAAMGSGGSFARYLLNRLHDEENSTTEMTTEEGVREAIYIIEEAKKVDVWCGGPIQCFCIKQSGAGYVLEKKKPSEIKRIVNALASADAEIKDKQREIFPSAGPNNSDNSKRQRRKLKVAPGPAKRSASG
jgi:20S proteasome alpha/beta subunit